MEIKKKIQRIEPSLKKKIDSMKKDTAYIKEILATKDVVIL